MLPLDIGLSRLRSPISLIIDFDGTICSTDVTDELAAAYAPDRWAEINGRYERGIHGSRTNLRLLWRAMGNPDLDSEQVRPLMRIDPGIRALMRLCAVTDGIELQVVSDGFGFYVRDFCRQVGVATAAADIGPDGSLVFSETARLCWCTACGTCKVEAVRAARDQGRFVVVVGDGRSDFYAACEADLVFAKGALRECLAAAGRPFVPFDELTTLAGYLAREHDASGGPGLEGYESIGDSAGPNHVQ